MRYALVTNHRYDDLTERLQKRECRTGLYQWAAAFHGERAHEHILLPRELEDIGPENFDVIHVNLIGGEMGLLTWLRELIGASSSTRIVANMDTSPQLWLQMAGPPMLIRNELRAADIVFGVEQYTADATELLIDRPVHLCPHPLDYEYVASHRKKWEERKNICAVLHASYDQQMTLPWLALKSLHDREKFGLAITNFNRGAGDRNVANLLYCQVLDQLPYAAWLKDALSMFKWAYEPRVLHAVGRNVMEAAALGVAVAGSDRMEALRRCYPETAHSPDDPKRGRDIMRRLAGDEEYAQEVAQRASEAVRYYDLPRARERFMAMLDSHEDAPAGNMTAQVTTEVTYGG